MKNQKHPSRVTVTALFRDCQPSTVLHVIGPVDIVADNQESEDGLLVSCDQAIMKGFTLRQLPDGALMVKQDNGDVPGNHRVSMVVPFINFSQLTLQGGATYSDYDPHGYEFYCMENTIINLYDGSQATVAIQTKTLHAAADDNSSIRLSGHAGRAHVSLSGNASFYGNGLDIKRAVVTTYDQSLATIRASEEAVIHAGGESVVKLLIEPTRSQIQCNQTAQVQRQWKN